MDLQFLSGTQLFQGILPEELAGMSACLGMYERRFPKGALLFRAGEPIADMGLVEEGSVHIVVHTYWGGSSILSRVARGELFGEAYAALPGQGLLCDVIACEDCRVLFVPMGKALTQCADSCAFHSRLIRNLVRISAAKNLALSNRMTHITPRTIRERLLSYLSGQMLEQGGPRFTIPFTRQQLADYLCVDRSALSHELSKMQQEGLLTCHKKEFVLSPRFSL